MFPDVDVLVLIADLEEFVEVGQHQFYQLGIEVLTFLLLDQRQYLVQRPGLLVAAIRAGASNTSASATTRPSNGMASPLRPRDSRCHSTFMVVTGDGRANLEQRQIAAGEHVCPSWAWVFMISHSSGSTCPVCGGWHRDAHLADVVQREARLMSSLCSSLMPSSWQNSSV